tara:strand:- start:583 stop:801 length:219 start_codon:yes stop_codon:yes gene_type:complete
VETVSLSSVITAQVDVVQRDAMTGFKMPPKRTLIVADLPATHAMMDTNATRIWTAPAGAVSRACVFHAPMAF